MKSRATMILAVALVLSNGFWLYRLFDAGVTLTYRDATLQEHREALAQALAILPVAGSLEASREDVIAAAKRVSRGPEPFEKNGFLWVGSLGLQFGADGRVKAAIPSWSPSQ